MGYIFILTYSLRLVFYLILLEKGKTFGKVPNRIGGVYQFDENSQPLTGKTFMIEKYPQRPETSRKAMQI